MNIWGKHLQRQFREQIGTCRTDLEFLHHSQTLDDGIQYQAFSEKLSHLVAQEDLYWRQRAKIYWLKDGDTNSKFFHASANARKKINSISCLSRDEDTMVNDHNGIFDVDVSYFQNLFQSGNRYHNKCAWKKYLVEAIFSHHDAEKILALPLLNVMENDKIIAILEVKGIGCSFGSFGNSKNKALLTETFKLVITLNMYGWKQDYGTSLNKSGIVEIAFSLLFLLSCRNPFQKLESKLERSFGVFGRHATQSFGNKYPLHLGLPTPLQCKTSLNGKKSKNQTIQQYSQTSSNITSWSPLQQNYFKCNLDAATF
ncbi:hypothetical protein D0Y65_020035 [Glycine soja]|uniref:Uncharacterized protein n=1 Tax=Glycine soja TaxID=3848 RepID=A0A445JBY8_GLYSO|nr:hypothetical protein D0Y65_020035 [Glycine soja]